MNVQKLTFAVLCAILVLSFSTVNSAKILGFFPALSISHQLIFQAIWKELSLRGHEVTVLTPDPLKDPSLTNLTEIDVHFAYKDFDIQSGLSSARSAFEATKFIWEIMGETVKREVLLSDFKDILKLPKDHFDLLLIEPHFPGDFGLGAIFDAPIIMVSSLGLMVTGHEIIGNPVHPVLYPDMLFGYDSHKNMNFFQKWKVTLDEAMLRIYTRYFLYPMANKVARECFGENIPDLKVIQENISMAFLNVNPLLYSPRPNVPGIVEMSQMNIKAKKPLPKDLKKILDEAKEGVVYFSLGSNVKSVNLSTELRSNIIGALGQLPYTVLWKWESDYLEGRPKNVITRKWLPQQDILGHPNIKVFVTQGGLQSAEEAIANGIPLVGMPFLGDQPMNVKKLSEIGVMIGLDPMTATKDQIKKAILEVAGNPKYKTKMLEARNILQDQPMTGLEKAVWWSEYVIRHKGAKHLRSPLLDLSWYQYFLLDIIAATFAVLFVAMFLVFKIVKFGLSLVVSQPKKLKSN